MALWAVAAVAVFGYCTLSFIFRLNPGILQSVWPKRYHRRNASRKSLICFHISHRGGAGEHIENTMTAFDHAAKVGTDMFELDCQITKDGKIVVAHDNNLNRLCGEDVEISSTNYKDLPLLLPTQRLDFNHKYQITSTSTDRCILLFEDLLKKYPKMPMNVDVKRNDPKLLANTVELIKTYKREDITVLGNSNHKTSEAVRRLSPHTYTLFTVTEVAKLLVYWYTGLLPFVKLNIDYFEIPMCSIFLEQSETFSHRIGALGLLVKFLDFSLTNRKLIVHLRKRGIPTYFFVLNAEHEWQRAVECGAAGIMTDFPSRLREWMNQR